MSPSAPLASTASVTVAFSGHSGRICWPAIAAKADPTDKTSARATTHTLTG